MRCALYGGMDTSTPSTLARFITSHDHPYQIHADGSVTIWIYGVAPYEGVEGWQGPWFAEASTVRTVRAAKEVMGY